MNGRRWLPVFIAVCALVTSQTHSRADGTLPPAGDYLIQVSGSTVSFSITEFLINTVGGRFNAFAGKVVVGDSLATTHIDATVDVASIDTGVKSRNEHLVGPDYFDAKQFPRMTFTSTAVWGTPTNLGIKGNLTIKGVTKEVVFSARILDSGMVAAETTIDRTDFGITTGGTIKNKVNLRLQIRMTKAPPPQ
jgi:polyisoprenoid-binding protein YceI